MLGQSATRTGGSWSFQSPPASNICFHEMQEMRPATARQGAITRISLVMRNMRYLSPASTSFRVECGISMLDNPPQEQDSRCDKNGIAHPEGNRPQFARRGKILA